MSRPRRVLAVEDERLIRQLLAETMQLAGYEVQTAANGRDALAILRAWRPDIILLDLMMPEMDGWQFRSRQRVDPAIAAIPVVLITAVRDAETQREALAADAVIQKPFDLEDIIDIIERLTGE